jgi:hypothetical protein
MGCNESREKERPPSSFTFVVATPLPLYLYQEYAYPIRKSPTSSESLSPTSSGSLSPTARASPTAKASPPSLSPTAKGITTAKGIPSVKNVSTLHYTKLKAIAHYKFPTFKDFSYDVQQEILHHIDKELQNVK